MISNESRHIEWRSPSTKKFKDRAARVTGYLIFGTMMAVLISIIEYVTAGALPHLTWNILTTQNTFPSGGIANAIIGTWMLVAVGLIITIPPGVLGPLYLINRSSNKRITGILRLMTDVLTSVPSIVVGMFGYLALVLYFGWGYSVLAGGFALAVMMLPYVIRVSELSMRSIPNEQVQNAYALGASDIQVASRIYLPQAMAGILSGVFLAISIAAGETAQLLYTVSWNNTLPLGFFHSEVGYLSGVVYYGFYYSQQPAIDRGFVAAFVLIVMLLGLIFLSKNSEKVVRIFSRFRRFLSEPENKGKGLKNE